jgi:hypothetical protein
MTRSPADLMRVNLLEVFNEPDSARRAVLIAENYAEDVVWHEQPDRTIPDRKDLERRAEELRGKPELGFPARRRSVRTRRHRPPRLPLRPRR